MAGLGEILRRHLKVLEIAYVLTVSKDYGWFIAHEFQLPPGFNQHLTDVLVEIPSGYPISPPGVSARVYLHPSLRFHGRRLRDLHTETTPGWGDWAWFCYERINWDPHRDDLVKFLEMIRVDLTDPSTQ